VKVIFLNRSGPQRKGEREREKGRKGEGEMGRKGERGQGST